MVKYLGGPQGPPYFVSDQVFGLAGIRQVKNAALQHKPLEMLQCSIYIPVTETQAL
ncbi:MAG: hypothetical protein KDK00_04420 [Rhodobacteraceae bacterium]|nr:hypothetical protein [Paracoccaceae bacterium]